MAMKLLGPIGPGNDRGEDIYGRLCPDGIWARSETSMMQWSQLASFKFWFGQPAKFIGSLDNTKFVDQCFNIDRFSMECNAISQVGAVYNHN